MSRSNLSSNVRRALFRWFVVRRHDLAPTEPRGVGRTVHWRYESDDDRSLERGLHLARAARHPAHDHVGLRLFAIVGDQHVLIHEIPHDSGDGAVSRLVHLPAGTVALELHGAYDGKDAPATALRLTRLGHAPLAGVLAAQWWQRQRARGLRAAARRGWAQAGDAWRSDGPLGVTRRLVRSQAAAQRSAPMSLLRAAPRVSPDERAQQRAHRLEHAEHTFNAFLASGRRLTLPAPQTPVVSILLVLFNRVELTYACLRSIAEHAGDDVEVVIVDNASTDRTVDLLARTDGATVVRNDENLGFVLGSRAAAAQANGEVLVFLNNDAELTAGAIASARAALAEPGVGVVGGPVLSPWDEVLEAGGMVWRDGSTMPYGRYLAPDDHEIGHVREVDYVTGCLLATHADLWRRLDGFDTAYAPAYYEDVDYCFRARAAGFEVRYDPAVVVRHLESASALSLEWVHERILTNRSTFVARHADALALRPEPISGDVLTARRVERGLRRIAVLDDRVPYAFHGSGSPRTRALLEALRDAGAEVTFVVTHEPEDAATIAHTIPRDVELVVVAGREELAGFLLSRPSWYDDVIVSRPHNMEALVALLEQCHPALASTRIVYDAEAVAANRDVARAAATGRVVVDDLDALVDAELALAKPSDLVLAVSPLEAEQFAAQGVPAAVVSHGLIAEAGPPALEERSGLLFVGNLAYLGSPNVDAIEHFIDDVLPTLRARNPAIGLVVAGKLAPEVADLLDAAGATWLGIVDDLTAVYAKARCFVAPTRFAAGIPLKVLEAAAHGVPVVASDLLARQLGWTDDELVRVPTGDGAAFAAACSRLLEDDDLWQTVRAAALARVQRDHAPEVFAASVRDALGLDSAENLVR